MFTTRTKAAYKLVNKNALTTDLRVGRKPSTNVIHRQENTIRLWAIKYWKKIK
jgi:hypothetical protein